MTTLIKKAYLCELDTKQLLLNTADLPIDPQLTESYQFLQKGIDKFRKSNKTQKGMLKEDSWLRAFLATHQDTPSALILISKEIATKCFQVKEEHEVKKVSDLFISEVQIDESLFWVGLEIEGSYTQIPQTVQLPSGTQNNLLTRQYIIPKPSESNSTFFMINQSSFDVLIFEQPLNPKEEPLFLYKDFILECDTHLSLKETIEKSRELAKEMVEEYNLNPLTTVPKLEQLIEEVLAENKCLDFKEIATEVFKDHEEALETYQKSMTDLGVTEPIETESVKKIPKIKTQRLKTDLGFEVKIPMDYCQNPDYVEIVNLPNGELSLQLKKIGNIKNI